MSEGASEEFRCFVGGLSWSTDDQALENNFRQFGRILEAKVIIDRGSGRSRGFGFVTFAEQRALDDAIEGLHNKELDGRVVTVNKAMPKIDTGGGGGGGGGMAAAAVGDRERERERDRDHESHRDNRDRDRYRDHHRDYYGYSNGGGYSNSSGRDNSGSAGRDDSCFRCGRQGHWARDCHIPSSSRDRYGGGVSSRPEREQFGSYGGGRYGDRGGDYYDRYGGGGERYSSAAEDASYGRDRRYDSYRDHREGRASGGPLRYESRDRPSPYDRPPPPPFDHHRSAASATAAAVPYDRPRIRGGRSSYDRY